MIAHARLDPAGKLAILAIADIRVLADVLDVHGR